MLASRAFPPLFAVAVAALLAAPLVAYDTEAHTDTGGDAADGLRPGTIVVADIAGDRVQVFSPDGVHAFDIGSRGAGDGQFSAPEGAAISPDGLIAVADTGNHRVQVFYPNGTFARAFGSQGSAVGQFTSPAAVAFAPQGDLIAVADTGNHRVSVKCSHLPFRAPQTAAQTRRMGLGRDIFARQFGCKK